MRLVRCAAVSWLQMGAARILRCMRLHLISPRLRRRCARAWRRASLQWRPHCTPLPRAPHAAVQHGRGRRENATSHPVAAVRPATPAPPPRSHGPMPESAVPERGRCRRMPLSARTRVSGRLRRRRAAIDRSPAAARALAARARRSSQSHAVTAHRFRPDSAHGRSCPPPLRAGGTGVARQNERRPSCPARVTAPVAGWLHAPTAIMRGAVQDGGLRLREAAMATGVSVRTDDADSCASFS
jgi:hypothetical protein